MYALIDRRQLVQLVRSELAPLFLLLGGQGRPGRRGRAGADASAGLISRIECTVPPGALSGATVKHPAGPSTIAGLSTAAWRVRVPPGSSWRVRLSTDGTITGSEALALSIYQALTVDGTYATIPASLVSLTDADGADPDVAGAIVVPEARWLTLGVSYTGGGAWGASVYCGLEAA